ncbi:6273_t:CDS:1, partial [Gigaspora margarita]
SINKLNINDKRKKEFENYNILVKIMELLHLLSEIIDNSNIYKNNRDILINLLNQFNNSAKISLVPEQQNENERNNQDKQNKNNQNNQNN